MKISRSFPRITFSSSPELFMPHHQNKSTKLVGKGGRNNYASLAHLIREIAYSLDLYLIYYPVRLSGRGRSSPDTRHLISWFEQCSLIGDTQVISSSQPLNNAITIGTLAKARRPLRLLVAPITRPSTIIVVIEVEKRGLQKRLGEGGQAAPSTKTTRAASTAASPTNLACFCFVDCICPPTTE